MVLKARRNHYETVRQYPLAFSLFRFSYVPLFVHSRGCLNRYRRWRTHWAWLDPIFQVRSHTVQLCDDRQTGVASKQEREYIVFYPLHNHQNTLFPIGRDFFLSGLVQVVIMCCTIVLLPMAIPYAKSLSTFFNPVGKVCVPVAVVNEIERRKAEKEVEKYLNN